MHAQRIALGLIVAAGFAQGGCSTVSKHPETLSRGSETVSKRPEPVTSATEIVYSGGRATQDFSVPLTNVGTAVTEAMADLKMTAIQPGRDGVVYKIQAKTEDNRTVMVTLRPHQMQTRVGCRVGLFGDEPLAKSLLERTGIRLGILPPARDSRACAELARLQPVLRQVGRARRGDAQRRRGSTLSRSGRTVIMSPTGFPDHVRCPIVVGQF